MSKRLYIKENIEDLSLEFGDILEYNDQTEMFEMNKTLSSVNADYLNEHAKVVKIDYSTAIDLILEDKAIAEEVEDKNTIEFKKEYQKIENQVGLEELNNKLNIILTKLSKTESNNCRCLNSMRRFF